MRPSPLKCMKKEYKAKDNQSGNWAVFSWCLTVAFKSRKNCHVTLMHYVSSYLTFDTILIRNLSMFFQGWREGRINILKAIWQRKWRINILKALWQRPCLQECFCILVPQYLEIDCNYKCGIGESKQKFSIMLPNHCEKQEECQSRKTAEQTLRKPILDKETFSAQHGQQDSISLGERKAAELSGLWLLEDRSYS